jgi:hypothetical protein
MGMHTDDAKDSSRPFGARAMFARPVPGFRPLRRTPLWAIFVAPLRGVAKLLFDHPGTAFACGELVPRLDSLPPSWRRRVGVSNIARMQEKSRRATADPSATLGMTVVREALLQVLKLTARRTTAGPSTSLGMTLVRAKLLQGLKPRLILWVFGTSKLVP